MMNTRGILALVWILSAAAHALATETENLGLAVLPTPAAMTVDGKSDDWDLSGGAFVCGDVEKQRDRFAVWVHAMYDAENLYVLARWTDETPLNNPGQVTGSYGFAGDCLQFRTVTAVGTPQVRGNHFTCWQDRARQDVIKIEGGKDFKEGVIEDAKKLGARQAFLINTDGKGYVQEIAIPWNLLTRDGRPMAGGDRFAFTVEPNFTIGTEGRLTLKDIFRPGVTPDRVFTFMASQCWGEAVLERRGSIQPRALRLADARELPVSMRQGVPAVDWISLAKVEKRKGIKPITIDMPEDGYVSVQILDRSGEVVCQLLAAEPMTKGRHQVLWDGLTTLNWRTPGSPVPPGKYTWRAIWHKGIGLRLHGWACNAGSAPWDSTPTSNWGGDHGVPTTCAAAGDQVFLGWNGAEAGKALLACDLEGNVRWKNSRQGMAGAEFVAADRDLVYAVNWGQENSNYLYRLKADTGAYANWSGGTADLLLKDLFPDARNKPNRVDGLAARAGKLFLSFASARFRREQVSNWRSLLENMKAGQDGGLKIWDRLDAGTRQRAEQWLAGKQSEDEGLKEPNYYTPGVREAVVEAFNLLLTDKSLGGENLSGDAMALAHRRRLEAAFPAQIVPLQTGMVVMVDAESRKIERTWELPSPRQLCVSGDRLVYVVADGKAVVALDPANAATRTVIDGLHAATGVAVDKEGQIYVALGDPDNQVKVFAPDGKPVRTIGRQGGRAKAGPWQQDGMAFVAGIAVDPQGRLWATEADMSPKRISVWDAKTGAFVKEFFGPTSYGALGGAINPQDPNLMVGHGCEWRLDPKMGQATCLGCFTREGMSNARFGVGSNGKLYLAVASAWAFNASDVRIFERLGDANYALRGVFSYEGKDATAKSTYWADENGDGQRQPNELTTVDGHVRFSGWYMNFTPDMTIYAEGRQYKLAGFTACGAPKYDLAHPRKMPANGLGSADGQTVLAPGSYGADSSWFECYDIASGKRRWNYPDNFVGVHGSHQACPPVVGMIRGSFGPCGVANLPARLGGIWVIATNVGEWHILNQDGFYVTRLFQGDPMKIHWPERAVPGAVVDNVPPGMGGEDFGGSIAYARDGKLYLQAGKTGFWNVEVVGLETVKALAGSAVEISAADAVEAEKLRVAALQAAVGTRKVAIRKRTPQFTGNLDTDFAGAEVISYKKQDDASVRSAAVWDDQRLYLTWDVRDPTPWINGADVAEQMYVGGDTVDFQIGANATADKKRAEAVEGDLRLSIGNFRGEPTAVLYRKVSATKKPKSFSSGIVKDYTMDYVSVLPDVKIKVALRPGHGYLVEAAVPLAALGLKPADGQGLPADFGVTHGGPDGQRTRLRTFWNNQHTGIVDDVVFELKMEPANWGQATFKQ